MPLKNSVIFVLMNSQALLKPHLASQSSLFKYNKSSIKETVMKLRSSKLPQVIVSVKYLQHIVGIFVLFLVLGNHVRESFLILPLVCDVDIDSNSLKSFI